MKRVHVIGSSGSGKTTLAVAIGKSLGLNHFELDAIRHGPNWIDISDVAFRKQVSEILRRESWVIDGNYSAVRDLIWERADTVVWLDYAFPVVFWRLLLRTFRRCATKEELWNGNKETFLNSFFAPDSVLFYAVRMYSLRRREFSRSLPEWKKEKSERTFFRQCSPRETKQWLKKIR
jgi:adenylate kinase family enzyme